MRTAFRTRLLSLLLTAALMLAGLPAQEGRPAGTAAAAGCTTLGGPIDVNTTWTLAASPYCATNSIFLSQGVTLTIEPGVEVRFDAGKAMQVDGQLIARGTAGQPIVFTSSTATTAPGDWKNLLFSASAAPTTYDPNGNYQSGSILQYVTVEYAGGGGAGGAIAMSVPVLVDHSTVRNNASRGIYALVNAAKITNNTVSGNGGGGLLAGSSSTISGNTISGNTANDTNSYGGGVYAGINSTISGNTISGNAISGANSYGGGVYANTNSTISGNTISGNTATYQGGGVYASTGNTISSNTISGNTATYQGGGVYSAGSGGAISGNAISGNTISGAAADNGGGGMYASGGAISGNTISGNTANSGKGGGVWAGGSAVSGNTISGNTASVGGGVYVSTGSTISGNAISGNTASSGGGVAAETNNSTISGNTISGNTANSGGGVYASTYNAISGNTISGNTASSGGGVAAWSSSVKGNLITDNKVTADSSLGSGIRLVCDWTLQVYCTAELNTVVGNRAELNPGQTSTAGGIDVAGYLDIRKNTVYGNQPYDLANRNPSSNGRSIDASNNYWGTTATADISAHIYDFSDDASVESVVYSPFLSAPDPGAPALQTAASLVIASGDGQSGLLTTTLAAPLVTQVLDTFGNAVSISVTFTIASAPAGATGQDVDQTTAGAQTSFTVNSDANGKAQTALTLGDKPGTYIVSVTSGTLPAVTFTATAIAGVPAKLAFTTQPDGASGGGAFSAQPAVAVQDANGNTVVGATNAVTLAITAGTGTADATLRCNANPATPANGAAAFAGCKINYAGAGYTLTASAAGLTAAVSNPFNVAVGLPAMLVAVGGDRQTGALNTALQAPFTAEVRDAGNNPVPAVALTWTVSAAPAGASGQSVSQPTDQTGADGRSSVTLTLGNQAGAYTVTAVCAACSVASSVTFTATIGPAIILTPAVAGPGQTVQVFGIGFSTSLQITSVLLDSAAAPGVTPALPVALEGPPFSKTFSLNFTLPASAALGQHTVTVAGNGSGEGSVQAPLTVRVLLRLDPDPAVVTLAHAPAEVQVWADAGAQQLDAVQFTLAFDPAKLQIADGDGNAANGVQLIPGPAFQETLQNTVNNTAGTIQFGAGRASGQTPPSGGLLLATLRVRGLAQGAWPLTFAAGSVEAAFDGGLIPHLTDDGAVTVPARWLVFTAQPLRGAAGYALGVQPVVTVQDGAGATQTGDNTTVVTLAIQHLSGAAGAALTCGQTAGGVTAATVQQGVATFSGCVIDLTGAGYVLAATASGLGAGQSGAFNVTLAGDTNGDCLVSVVDFSLVVTHFGEISTSAGWDYRADLNGDLRVSALDFSMLVTRFGATAAACAPASNGGA